MAPSWASTGENQAVELRYDSKNRHDGKEMFEPATNGGSFHAVLVFGVPSAMII